jgi:predicted Zn-dependent peptidase
VPGCSIRDDPRVRENTVSRKEITVSNKITFAIMLAVLAAATVFAQVNIKFVEYDLPNGLHVILHQDKSVPIVAQVMAYHVGSKNEKPDRTGFAHFFEHLMFEGSPHIPRGQFFKMVQNAGGELNAFTSFDKTVYFISVPSNQIELAMYMESERMLQLRVDSTGIETQRGVVKEERKQSLENRPYGSIGEQTFSHAYKVHPYRWVPIGSAQYIDRATYDEFHQFYKTFYVPNNACLVLAGDIDVDKTKELVAKYYGDIPRGTGEIYRPNVTEPPQKAEVRDTVYDNIQLPATIEAYHMPAQGTKDYYALSMLTTLLSGGESSRLNKRLVDKDKIAVVVQSIPFELEDPSLFLVFGIANFGKSPKEIETAAQQEIDRVKKELVTESEFTKIRNQKEAGFIEKNRGVLGKAMQLADYHLFFGDTNLINSEIGRFLAVTRDDIKRVANDYLVDGSRTVLYYLPKTKTQ